MNKEEEKVAPDSEETLEDLQTSESAKLAEDLARKQRRFWIWEAPRYTVIAHFTALIVTIFLAVSLSDYRSSFFPDSPYLGWFAFFALVVIPGVLVEIVVESLVKKHSMID